MFYANIGTEKYFYVNLLTNTRVYYKVFLGNPICILIYEEVYGEDSKEMAALVTELAGNAITSSYIANFGCEEYHKYDKTEIFKEKYDELLKEVAQLNIPDVER